MIYFVTMAAILGSFDLWTLVPFMLWLGLYVVSMRYFVPRLGRVAQLQADARSLMTGRITDAYTNIATVKLFSHSQREAGFARSAMQEFLSTVYRQMRLVSGFEIINQVLSVILVGSTAGMVMLLWTRGEVGVGAVAAATAPTPTSPRVHSTSTTPAVLAISSTDSTWLTISKPLTRRICRYTVTRNSCIAERAKPASRCECENSLTVEMLV